MVNQLISTPIVGNPPASGGTGALTLGPSFGDGVNSIALAVGAVTLSAVTSGLLPSKDVYFDNVAGCVTDVNRNGGELQVEGVVATKKDVVVGWDVSSFPAGANVTGGNIKLTVQTVPVGAVNPNDVLSDITAAAPGEGWAEATTKCSAHPTKGAALGAAIPIKSTLNGGVVGDVYTLNFGAYAVLAGKMGVGSHTIYVDSNAVTDVNHAFYDKENGSAAQSAQLSFNWNKTL